LARAVLGFCFVSHYSSNTDTLSLSLHDALPIYHPAAVVPAATHPGIVRSVERGVNSMWNQWTNPTRPKIVAEWLAIVGSVTRERSEEHTSELQSRENLVCRLLLEKQKNLLTI